VWVGQEQGDVGEELVSMSTAVGRPLLVPAVWGILRSVHV
jgi:hypothetical protein